MAGAPAGPALDPERPADRLDAARETDESRPVRRPDERKHRPDQLVHLGLLRLGHALSGDAGQPPAATTVARTLQLDRRLAVLAEDNKRCWSSRAPWRAWSRGGRCSAGAPGPSCSRTPDARRAAPRRAAEDYVVGSPLKAGG